jgi:hypothetical protein
MKTQIVIGFMIIVLATCSMPEQTPITSGVEGVVLIGPTCPVVQAGQECSDQPYQATLTINDRNGKRITQIQTNADGEFTIPLAPGAYQLHPESPNSLPFAVDQEFTVQENAFTRLIIIYDSGIR